MKRNTLLVGLTSTLLFSCGGNVYKSTQALDQSFASLKTSTSNAQWVESENNFEATLNRLESQNIDSAAFCEALQSRSVEDQVIILSEVENSPLAKNCLAELNQTATDYLQPFRDKLAKKNIKPTKINQKKLYAPANQYKFLKGTENFIAPKEVILTFDDGPVVKNTSQVIELLKQWDLKVMFFMVGDQVVKTEGTKYAKYMKSLGHTMATHSKSHIGLKNTFKKGGAEGVKPVMLADLDKKTSDELLTALSPELKSKFVAAGANAVRGEIIDNHKNIDQLLGGISPFFRFPGGTSSKALDKVVNDDWGLSIWNWNLDSLDYATPNPDQIVKKVIGDLEVYGRGMLLFHDIHAQTSVALPEILKYLADNNYTILIPVEK